MPMKNYRDVSPAANDLRAGFQFEFFCEQCQETWRSPFKPFRVGQATAWFQRFATIFYNLTATKISRATDTFYDANLVASKAKAEALVEAEALASQRYQRCKTCHRYVCADDWGHSGRECASCEGKAGGGAGEYGAEQGAGPVCPNCQTPSQGGRFCHECGFDMASTHKSCPGRGATMARQARFCTDCGHGF